MTDEFDKIKNMFDNAALDEKNEFLFRALVEMRNDMKTGFDLTNESLMAMKKVCECRKKDCGKEFVTKNQSRLFGIIILFGATMFGLGAGYITFFELVKAAVP